LTTRAAAGNGKADDRVKASSTARGFDLMRKLGLVVNRLALAGRQGAGLAPRSGACQGRQ
jgi:ABC-type transporter Mla maintaining outer membrane lipid asymmetry permease subunit MlaE